MVLEVITGNDDDALTMPVMADEQGAMWEYAAGMESVGLPFTVVLDRGVVVESAASGTQSSQALELL